ncbi:MAG TPA: YafY family protein [Steroidobacteraceae bacterium]|nr:YafY family protein [Steroidobacteraceae bacterium]
MSQPTTRVLALLEMLQAREVTGGAELARALEVDRRTLRRYIVMLEELGIPIVTTQGRYGGYQVVPGFKLPPMIFSDEEALALAVGLMAARGLGLAQSMPALATARAKLERVFPAKLKSRLRAVDESVALEFTRSATAIDQQVLGLLCGATQERRRVRLTYQSRSDEQTEREFDPYGLVYRAGRWYIVGWCHLRRGLRSFRLDRVVAASTLAVSFERPEKFDALAYLKDSISQIPRAHAVEVLLETDLATAQKCLLPYVGVIECVDDGVLLRAQADNLDWIARELARLPFDFEVKAPQPLRTAIARIARRLDRLAATRAAHEAP